MGQGLIVFWMMVTLAFATRKEFVMKGDSDVLSVTGLITVGCAQLFPGNVWLSASVFVGLTSAGIATLIRRMAKRPTKST